MTIMTQVRPRVKSARRRSSKIARRHAVWGLIFLSPWIIGFLAFTFLPMLASLVFSFMNFNLVRPEGARFIGLANYIQLFNDPYVWQALFVSFGYNDMGYGATLAWFMFVITITLTVILFRSASFWVYYAGAEA